MPVAPAATPPGTAWSAWRPAATWLTFAGDAVFAVEFEHPEWYNGFEHDPEEAARAANSSRWWAVRWRGRYRRTGSSW